jgi:cell division protein FtsW (lipid II flippase)
MYIYVCGCVAAWLYAEQCDLRTWDGMDLLIPTWEHALYISMLDLSIDLTHHVEGQLNWIVFTFQPTRATKDATVRGIAHLLSDDKLRALREILWLFKYWGPATAGMV